MNRFIPFFSLLFLFCSYFISCSEPLCLKNSSCEIGLVCQNNQCTGCKTSSQCDTGFVCFNQRCTRQCRNNAECSPGQTCSEQKVCLNSGSSRRFEQTACSDGEVRRCFDAAADLLGVGSCGQGLQLCLSGAWGPCKGQILPAKEVCDGKDNDCDGKTDEDTCADGKVCNSTTKACEKVAPCSDVQCPQGQVCNSTTGVCELVEVHPCTHVRCPTGYRCDETGTCKKPSCSKDDECPKRQICVSATCVDGCRKTGCSKGKECNEKTDRCEAKSVDCNEAGCSRKYRCNQKTGLCEPHFCSGVTCKQGEVCDPEDGLCKKIAKTFEKCGVNNIICDPKANQECVLMDNDVQHGYCFATCSNNSDPSCKGTCIGLGNNRLACLPNGTKKVDQTCAGQDPDAKIYDHSQNCVKGTLCIRLNSSKKGICSTYNGASCSLLPCAKGKKCLSLASGEGVCLKTCSSDPGLCSEPNTVCEQLNHHGQFCAPEPPYGPKKYGETCNPKGKVEKEGCVKGFVCLPTDKSGQKGFCTSDCSQTSTCKGLVNSSGTIVKAECVPVNNSSGCFFTCSPTSRNSCPDDLSCQRAPSGKDYCLPK